jgi:hypothetical protein
MNTREQIPALITYLSPFRIVENDGVTWTCTLKEVNSGTYDGGKLATLVGSIDVGLTPPLCLHVGLDGALVLPVTDTLLPAERAADYFNRFLAQICLGGIYSHAVMPEDIESCDVLDGRIAWYFNPGKSFRSLLHGGLKYKTAGSIMSIVVLEPQKIHFSDLVEAHFKGHSILSRASSLTPEFLIRGVTGLKGRSWNYALAELWVCVEQMTTILWKRSLETKAGIGGRPRKDLLGNHQSWTTSVRQEVLFQRGLLDEATYARLMGARKARNGLSHDGVPATEEQAVAALESTIRLLGILSHDNPEALMDVLPQLRSRPYEARTPTAEVLQHAENWRPIGGLANTSLHQPCSSTSPKPPA